MTTAGGEGAEGTGKDHLSPLHVVPRHLCSRRTQPMPEAQPRSPFPTSEVAPAETPGPQGVMTLAVAVVTLAALYFGREVFIPIVVAVLLAFVLAPVVDLLRRLRLGRVPSVVLATLLALG